MCGWVCVVDNDVIIVIIVIVIVVVIVAIVIIVAIVVNLHSFLSDKQKCQSI